MKEDVANDFQIQEMVHQDSDGVLFQALDKQTGRLVALNRFFLQGKILAKLRKKEEGGKSLFDERMAQLKALEVPHVQKVLGGGFDEIDETPYVVAEWVDGMSLKEGFEKKIFSEGEGAAFEAQARATLSALPEELGAAICMTEEEVLTSRDESGGLKTLFRLSPRRYFGVVGGMNIAKEDQEKALKLLVERFPVVPSQPVPAAAPSELVKSEVKETEVKGKLVTGVASTGVVPMASSTPVLKSAQKSGKAGVLWGSLAGLIALLGVGGWLVFATSKDEDEVASNEEGVSQERQHSSQKAPLDSALEEEPVEEKKTVETPLTREELAAERVENARKELAEAREPNKSRMPNTNAFRIEEKSIEGEIDLFGDEEENREEENEENEENEELAEVKEFYTPEDVELLKKIEGEEIDFRGKVSASSRSGGGEGVLLYLDFGQRSKHPFVSFQFENNPTPVKQEEWDAFIGKEVTVKAVVGLQRGQWKRGSGVVLMIQQMDQVQMIPEEPTERVYQFSDLDDLRVVSEGEKVIFEGDFKNYQAKKPYVYLFFEDGFSIVGRFEIGGPLSNAAFADQLNEFKGQRLRIEGEWMSDENANFEVAIHLNRQDSLSLAE